MIAAVRSLASPPAETPDQAQRRAADPGSSVWVNASAGSGKTTVLVRRVTRLLLDGVKPQRILCLTFTRAAAAEMANRVTAELAAWAVCGENELSGCLADLLGAPPTAAQRARARRLFAATLACPGGMRIRTIHAFCQEILGRFPVEAGLPPQIAVIEERDADALRCEALTDVLRQGAAAPHSALARSLNRLIETLGEHQFRQAAAGLFNERGRLQAAQADAGGLPQLIARLRAALGVGPEETEDKLVADTCAADFPRDDLRRAAVAMGKGRPTSQKLGGRILRWLACDTAGRIAGFEDYVSVFLTAEGTVRKILADKASCAAWDKADEICRAEAEWLLDLAARRETLRLAETTEAVLAIGDALARRYAAAKARRAVLDYDDLISRANALLHRPGIAPWVLFKLDGGLDHILVDEAQDTSRAQWQIVQALTEEFFAGEGAGNNQRSLFVVGDEKQSIFSFQHADPDAFNALRAYFAARLAGINRELAAVELRVSFRSAPAILEAVDAIFAQPEAQAGVSVDAVKHLPAPLRAGEMPKQGRVEVWPLLPLPPKEEAGEAWPLPLEYETAHDQQAELAAQIAATIKGWITTGEILPGFDRPIAPGDVMILLRERGRFADLMVRALKQAEVPVTGVDRMVLTAQLPVMDLLALLRFALLPEDDLNCATVLRGPLLGISEAGLEALAARREGSLWHALTLRAARNPSFKPAHEYLAGLLAAADFSTPFLWLMRVLTQPCPASEVSGRQALWARLGVDALDPVEELLEAAQAFSRRHAPSLQQFLHWIDAGTAQIKREMDTGKDAAGGGLVRIMTVHAAKGLEAPIVFLPDKAAVPDARKLSKFLWSAEEIPFYAAQKPRNGAALLFWQSARQKQLEEYRRLFYVALTRASHRLYLCGWEVRKGADDEGCWHRLAERGLSHLDQPHLKSGAAPPLIVFADPVLKAPTAKEAAPVAASVPLPAWALRPPPPEQADSAPVSPSQIGALPEPAAAPPDSAFARGRLIHRLLQSLPDMPDARRDDAARRFLASPQHNLTPDRQSEIAAEVLQLIRDPAYAPLFAAGSRAEVALAGSVDGIRMSGQVDRLCFVGNEIWVVDYKSNRPPPAGAAGVPELYRAQLAAYRAILAELYPGQPIRCFLLWTYAPKLMELAGARLGAMKLLS